MNEGRSVKYRPKPMGPTLSAGIGIHETGSDMSISPRNCAKAAGETPLKLSVVDSELS
jgi:hypothetical protein